MATIREMLRELIQSEAFDFVFHGHTHVIRDERIGPTRSNQSGGSASGEGEDVRAAGRGAEGD